MTPDYFSEQPTSSEIKERVEGYPSWLEIDLDDLTHNLEEVRKRVGVEVMAVVKNNAYGHGLLPVTTHLSRMGVEWFLVVKLDEAIRIKEAGIPGHIVSMAPAFTETHFETIAEKGITQVVYTEETARRLSAAAVRTGSDVEVFVKVDTGLRRVGVDHSGAADFIGRVCSLPGIDVKGMFSTFMQHPDRDSAQLEAFLRVDEELKESGVDLEYLSMASSDAVFHNPESWLDMVRPGTALYGVYPGAKDEGCGLDLRQALSLKARVEYAKWVEKGDSITYFGRFIAPERMRVGTLHVGFYDGIPREMANKGSFRVGGDYKPSIGSVSLNHCLLDLTSTDTSEGDVVYSLMNHLNPATPRVYLEKGRPVALLESP
jgi:alanine racemase